LSQFRTEKVYQLFLKLLYALRSLCAAALREARQAGPYGALPMTL